MKSHNLRDNVTSHAQWRKSVRSIREADWRLFQDFADTEQSVRGGAYRMTMSEKAIKLARMEGYKNDEINRARRLCAISCDGRVLTIYRRDGQKNQQKPLDKMKGVYL